LYRYFVSQSSEFYRHNTFCCFPTRAYCCKRMFRYRLSPESSGYTLLSSCVSSLITNRRIFMKLGMNITNTNLEVSRT